MAIRFYQPLTHEIKVLSFDLDDTLYQNEQVIRLAEQAQREAIKEWVPQAQALDAQFWSELKWQVLQQYPEVCHDVSQWRYLVLKAGFAQVGVTEEAIVERIFQSFYQARSDFSVPHQTFEVLEKLRQSYRLVAVTNGNADIEKLGLAPYFTGYYRAGEQGCRMKPHPDMLLKVAADMGLSHPEEILHIGDNLGSDIQAAHNAGTACFWFNPDEQAMASGVKLPNAEYSDLSDLLLLT